MKTKDRDWILVAASGQERELWLQELKAIVNEQNKIRDKIASEKAMKDQVFKLLPKQKLFERF